MEQLLVGYARVSTDGQDLTVQRQALAVPGVAAERIYVDHGLTGTNRERPRLREALAACRPGDTLVVTELDRLARSVADAQEIVIHLTNRGVKLQLGGSVHDPSDPVGRLLFNVLAIVAEFESDLIRARTREGMALAKEKGRLRGKQPKLSSKQEAHLVALHHEGNHTGAELAELFNSPGRRCTEPSSGRRLPSELMRVLGACHRHAPVKASRARSPAGRRGRPMATLRPSTASATSSGPVTRIGRRRRPKAVSAGGSGVGITARALSRSLRLDRPSGR